MSVFGFFNGHLREGGDLDMTKVLQVQIFRFPPSRE